MDFNKINTILKLIYLSIWLKYLFNTSKVHFQYLPVYWFFWGC